MAELNSIIRLIEENAPLELQEAWDNCGFQVKVSDGNVHRVLVALDATYDVIKEAHEKECQLIISHHPLIFSPIKSISYDDEVGKIIKELIQNEISLYSSHTAFDKCKGGNNDYLGELLLLDNISFMEDDDDKICRIGYTKQKLAMRDFIYTALDRLNIDKSMISFIGDLNSSVSKIGWCTGSGSDYMKIAKNNDCDLFITGDVKYHSALFARDLNLNVLDLGHYGTEWIFCENVKKQLAKLENLELVISEQNKNPFSFI